MTCSEEFSTLCSIFSTSVLGYVLYNYSSILSFMIHGTGKGIIRQKKSSTNAIVDTTDGCLYIPIAKLPCLDWNVQLFKPENTEHINDGPNNLEVVSNIDMINCKIKGRNLLCEFFYPEDLGSKRIRVCISSIFDNECYIFTVEGGNMIDYRKYIKELENHLEDL